MQILTDREVLVGVFEHGTDSDWWLCKGQIPGAGVPGTGKEMDVGLAGGER